MAAAVMQVDDRASTPTPQIARCIAALEGHFEVTIQTERALLVGVGR